MGIVKVERVNLVDEVYRQILQQITSGNWQEGDKIASENQLTKSFAVSRVVIREALQRLRSEKYIITRQGIGSFVTNPANYEESDLQIQLSPDMYRKLIEFRQAVEFAAVALSVEYAAEEDRKRLFDCVEQMKATVGDVDGFTQADFNFHFAVVQCSRNELLIQAMQANRKIIIKILKEMNRVPKSQEFAIVSHFQIAEAISQKNVKTALEVYNRNTSYNTVRLTEFYTTKKTE